MAVQPKDGEPSATCLQTQQMASIGMVAIEGLPWMTHCSNFFPGVQLG